MTIIAAIILAILLPLTIFDLLFRPTIRRLGLRNVTRRRSEALLLIGGSMLATALITASFVVGQSFDSSIRNIATTSLGPIDEIVFPEDSTDIDRIESELRAADSDLIDGILQATLIDLAAGSVGEDRLVEPDVRMIEVDRSMAEGFGDQPEFTGVAEIPNDLSLDEVVISQDLAFDLKLEAGDPIDIFAEAIPHRFTVRSVVPTVGLTGMAQVIAAPGALTTELINPDQVARKFLLVSNTGDVFGGYELTDQVVEIIEPIAGPATEITTIKEEIVTAADQTGSEMTALFGSIGGFSVAAGILLVVNLFTMLAAERKRELGTMRAVGLKRSLIVRAFALEGALYGIVAAAIGAIAGVGVGAGVVAYAQRNLVSAGDSLQLSTSVSLSDMATGALIGFAISQATVVFTTLRMTKFNIIRALKDLPEPRRDRRSKLGIALGIVGLVIAGGLMVATFDTPFVALVAPVIGLLALIPLVSVVLPERLVRVVASLAGVFWVTLAFGILPDTLGDPEISLFLTQGVILVGLSSIIIASLDGVWLTIASRLTKGGVGTKLGLAHPLDRSVRSVMLVAMYALVLITVTFMGVVSTVFRANGPRLALAESGDYQIVLDSNASSPLTTEELMAYEGVTFATPIVRGFADLAQPMGNPDTDDYNFYRISGLDESFTQQSPPVLTTRSAEYTSDLEAWEAVVNSSPQDITPQIIAPADSFEIGEKVVLTLNQHQVETEVVGTMEHTWLSRSGLMISDNLVPALSDDAVTATRFFITTDGDPEALASSLTASYPTRGVDATTFNKIADEEADGQEGFMNMLEGYLGLGLLIGIAGLSVVLVRAVRERRRQTGVLRAIGIPAREIRIMFLVEALFIGVQGVVLGIGLGLLTSWQMLTKTATFDFKFDFSIPAQFLITLGLGVVAASVLASIIPSIRAGSESPAEALRVTS